MEFTTMTKYFLGAVSILFGLFPLNAQQLEPIDWYEDYEPIWSADGQKIVYCSSIGNHPTQNIFMMRANGREVRQLTFSKSGYGNCFPSPSPDGQHIAYVSEKDGNREIYLMDVDGSNHRRLTNHPSWDGERVGWASDSRSFVFHSDRDGNLELYQYGLETGQIERLTNNGSADRWGSFSPDGKRLVFESSREGNAELFLMDLTDLAKTRLTDHWADDGGPAWSPDGAEVYFYSNRDDVNYEIYALDVATKEVRRITHSHNWDLDATIAPDGKKMVWHSSRNGHYGVVVSNIDGSGRQRLTNHVQSDFYHLVLQKGWDHALNTLGNSQLLHPKDRFFLEEELVDLMHILAFTEKPNEALSVGRYLMGHGTHKGYACSRTAELLQQFGHWAPPTQSQFFDLLSKGEFDSAMKAYEQSKQLDPDWLLFEKWEQFILLQIIWKKFYQKKAFKKAIQLYGIALDYYPDSYGAYHDMANCYLALENKELGLEFHRKAFELDPNGWYGKDSKQILEKIKYDPPTD